MFKEEKKYTKPSADILVIDIDQARMIALESTEIGDGEDDGSDPGWDFED